MKTIVKYFKTLTAATKYQSKLYNKYNYVRLIDFPNNYSGFGNYIWVVDNNTSLYKAISHEKNNI